ncbi:MAG: dUTP diphosphatase [Chlamydiia bacterium]|nr:dUTP diphosphatase [Chlamydiia bacterium]
MPNPVTILTTLAEGAKLPSYGTDEAAGADIRAHLERPKILAPGERALIPTGLKFEIPKGYEIQVRPRSGLAIKHGITVLNTPGTIDSDYRGDICIIVINTSNEPFEIEPGMRLAQLVVSPVLQAIFQPAEMLAASARGAGGFGSTGTH